MQRWLDYLAYLALRCVVAVIQAAPLGVCDRGARGIARLLTDVVGFRRGVIDDNLKTALPDSTPGERRRLTLEMWRHLALLIAEIVHAPRKLHRTNWKRRCDIPEVTRIVRALSLDRPKVIISGHYGNFELGGYLLGLFGFPSYTVARPLDNPYVDRWLNSFRERTGQHMLPKEGSSDAIQAVLNRGGVLALLGDQSAGGKAVWVNFFGRPASTHKAVALFTLGNQAPTLVLATRRLGAPLQYEVELNGLTDPRAAGFDLGDVEAVTEWFTRRLEELILRDPTQYWWVHRRWKHTPPPRVAEKLARG